MLAEAVLALGRPVVVLLASGRPLVVPWLVEKADAVLAIWFPGSEAGNAVADILTGRWNPSGRLAVSWPASVGQIPIFYAERPTGRPAGPQHYTSKYLDAPVGPLFPFGHGLSYTRFALANLRAAPHPCAPGVPVALAVEVANEGGADGWATVFFFVRPLRGAVARPVLALKAMTQLWIRAGATVTATATIGPDDFRVLGPDLTPEWPSGPVEIRAGTSADAADQLVTVVECAAG